MGKASSTKKVARAARTGGGRTRRGGSSSWVFPGAMALIVVVGSAGIVLSKESRHQNRPLITDHWHAAIGLFVCDKFEPDLPQPARLIGLHTHGDGLIHVEPQLSKDTGKSATLGRWLEGEPDMKLSSDELTVRGTTYKNDHNKCGDKPGRVQVKSDKQLVKGDPRKLRLRNGQLITVAFAPVGANLPEPRSKGNLAKPNTMEGQPPSSAPATSVPPASGPPTTAAGAAPTTVAPGPPASPAPSPPPASNP